jgi:UDP-glucose 4-epimerase
MTVYGDGSQVRSFTWVKEAVRAAAVLMDAAAAEGGTFNIGSQEPVTIRDLAERVRRLTGSASPIVHVPYRDIYGDGFEDARYRVPDTARLAAAAGFRPAMTLDAMLAEIITHLRGQPPEFAASEGVQSRAV